MISHSHSKEWSGQYSLAPVRLPYYHRPAMASMDADSREQHATLDSLVEQVAASLRGLLGEVATRLRPFPAFLNMVSLQAVELDPILGTSTERGCVVVLPGGEICELDLKVIPGIEGIGEADQVEEVRESELPPEKYMVYAACVVRLLSQELRRRRP